MADITVRDTHASNPRVPGPEWTQEWADYGKHCGHRAARPGDVWLRERWLNDAWPLPDPDDPPNGDDCVAVDRPAGRMLEEIQGVPNGLPGGGTYPGGDGEPNARSRMPKPKDAKQFALDLQDTVAMNERMLPAVCVEPTSPTSVTDVAVRQQITGGAPALITAGPGGGQVVPILQEEEGVRSAFEMFQTMRERIGYLYAFDIPQALDAAGLPVNDGQAGQLRDGFSLLTGDLITFEQFRHMAQLMRDGQLKPSGSPSPPRIVEGEAEGGGEEEEEGPQRVPGEPGYKVTTSGDKKKKGKDDGPAGPKGRVDHHKWMESKMGDNRKGVEIPDKVMRQFYNVHSDRPALLQGRDDNRKWAPHPDAPYKYAHGQQPTVEALVDNKPVAPPKEPPQPDLAWSPFGRSRKKYEEPLEYRDGKGWKDASGRRVSANTPWLYYDQGR